VVLDLLVPMMLMLMPMIMMMMMMMMMMMVVPVVLLQTIVVVAVEMVVRGGSWGVVVAFPLPTGLLSGTRPTDRLRSQAAKRDM